MRLIATALFLLLTAQSMAAISATRTKADETPWYRVEVIIFSQQDLFNAEEPRRDIELTFPSNSLYLRDPNQPSSETDSTNTLFSNNGTQIQNADSSSTTSVAHAVLDVTQHPDQLPVNVAEKPFLVLDKDLHQLGPDHYTLNRAAGYRVLYHQAWRQPGTDFQTAPWIIVQGGEQYDERFEMEGAIRLVKSRHLHIQADIWKTDFEQIDFSNLTSEANQLATSEPEITVVKMPWPELPKLPVIKLTVIEDINALEPAVTELIDQGQAEKTPSSEQMPSSEPTLLTEQNLQQTPEQSTFQVARIVQLKQSLKLSLNKMGYLDHPNLGLLVVVQKYFPEPD